MKLVALTDVQGVRYDPKAWNVTMKFLKDYKPDHVVINGDFTDLNMLSKYVEHSPGDWDNLQEEYDHCNKLLDEVQKYTKAISYPMGNHEERAYKYVAKYPYLKGTLEVDKKLHLKERGINWLRWNGVPFNFGPINFIHGEYIGEGHAKKTVSRYNMNIFYGHTHDVQCHSIEQFGETLVGQSMGCLCKYDMEYVQKRPTNWQQAFGVFDIYGKNYNYTIVRINDDYSFVANGKKYD